MAQPYENKTIDDVLELLTTNGFEGMAEAVTVLLNSAMVAERSEYLGASPYERSSQRISYANGFKDKALKTRLGSLSLKVPQTRDSEFYPQSLEKGLRFGTSTSAGDCGDVCAGRVDSSSEENR